MLAHDLAIELVEDVCEQVVGHRARRRGALELHQDRGRLGVADPDRQEPVPVGRLQQHDRLLADQVEADAVDDHLVHGRPFLMLAPGPCTETSPTVRYHRRARAISSVG